MPKRTNEFQQIILMIQKQLAGDAVVTESKMIESVRTGSRAEVDIVINSKIAGVELAIGIECTAKGRPATVEWVREIIGKHQDLPLNKSILVSKSNYTAEALRTAEAHGFLALRLEQAEKLDWKELLGDIGSLMLGSFVFKITGGSVECNKAELASQELILQPNTRIHEKGRDSYITFVEFTNGIIHNKKITVEVMQQWVKTPQDKRQGSFEFAVTMIPDNETKIEGQSGTWSTVKKVQVQVCAEIESTPLSLRPSKFLETSVAHGSAKNIFPLSGAPDKDVLVALVKNENKSSASLLIPQFEGADNKIFITKMLPNKTQKKNSTNGKGKQQRNK